MDTQVQRNEGNELPLREKQVTREQGTYQGQYFEPAVDIYETEEALVVTADVPGVLANDIETDVRDNLLTLTAKVGSLDSKWKPLYREYSTGHFVRQFRLGQQIDQSRITAELRDGVLRLTLPKAEKAKPRRIAIQTL